MPYRHGCETTDKTKARAEEREKNIEWIKRLFTAWRVSHAERTERRAEREEAGELAVCGTGPRRGRSGRVWQLLR